MAQETLSAVHDDDLPTYLESLGLFSDLKAGRIVCKFCADVITLVNLHALFPDSGNIRLTCSKPECIKKLMGYLSDR